MAEIAAALAGPAIEVVKWAAKPITRQFNYLCCFASNITSLTGEAEKLDVATRGLQEHVDRETENVRVIVPEVVSWLTKSKDINDQKDTILDEVLSVKSGCLKLGARFSLSKRAKETTDRMKELRAQKNFDAISQRGPPTATQEIPLAKTYEFESRKKLEDDIITSLRDRDVNMIGICGMGGLGKTSMAQKIMNRVLKEQVFEEVVMIVISQQVDKSNVQVEIGGSLGLDLRYDTYQVRIQKLHARLTGMKRILLVLDDVWEGLELHGLGIPCDSKQCKILVTSRNKDALFEMGVQNVFGMEVLPVEDAWFLFRERAGTCVDEKRLNPIAKEVVNECGGLPIALTAVGTTLKDEKDASIWKDALRQLRQCDQDIPDFIEKVYNPLKLSYDFLRSRQAKALLLLCCLFPEDVEIPLERLAYCCMGLGIFEGIRSLEGARNKMRSLTKMLKARSLLLDDGSSEHCVRMHDVVRDVCKVIAKQEGYIGGNDCVWISSSELIEERTSRLEFPNLHFLLSTQRSELDEEFKLESVFLEGTRDLHVLWIENSSLTKLPQPLTNLKTLVLDSCEGLRTIFGVGELVNLEILICRKCHSLEELPPEMKGLNRLKLLQLKYCVKLQSIGRGIISSLVGLEELKVLYSFDKWEPEDREGRKNAGLRELQALTNLTCLEIQIENGALVAENMHISTKLDRFKIMISPVDDHLPPEFYYYDKKLSLRLERETCLGHWIEMQLLRETESLCLWGNSGKTMDFARSCPNIRCLRLSECGTTKNIVTTPSYDEVVDAAMFPSSLEYVELYSLPQLQEISISFQNLSSIRINDCPRLPNLAMLSVAEKDCFPQLQELRIERCEMMEQVLLWIQEEDNNMESRTYPHVKFPKLKEVRLVSLPNLVTFCHGIEGIAFPQLRRFFVEKCPKRTSMVSCNENGLRGTGNDAQTDDEHSSHLFCQLEKVSFDNLKELKIDMNPFCGHEIPASSYYNGLETLTILGYEGSKNILSSSVARNLVNLKTLRIEKCDEMVQVIKDDDDDEEENTRILANTNVVALFPKLEELSLNDLPKLVSFCKLKGDVVLPSLKRATIQNCRKMNNLSFVAPNFKAFTTDFNNDLGFDHESQVIFDRLKILWIAYSGSVRYPFHHHKFFTSLVEGLEELHLYGHGSTSLFPSSLATKLVNLRSLRISSCDETEKVTEEEEDATLILFPKLNELLLLGLPKLVSFSGSRKCVVELPSLTKVNILGCPVMKCFSRGPLTAPNLESVVIENRHFGGETDLNKVLQQHYYSA